MIGWTLRRTLCVLALLLLSLLYACASKQSSQALVPRDVVLSLHEKRTETTSYYTLNLVKGKAVPAQAVSSKEIPRTKAYGVLDGTLVRVDGLWRLMDATEILFQGEWDGLEVLIIREEYNSFSSPMRLLSALSGHPLQVSKIVWVTVKNGDIVHEKELRREPSSYGWKAVLLASEDAAKK